MARQAKTSLFNTPGPRAETPMDKTTRAVRQILDDEAEKRSTKTSKLRKARLEREAATPKAEVKAPTTARKKIMRKT
ncbi:hypothetical protein [Nioella aestuarii]|uniref:hypothetical protein n=1 Tax=Nioella aestuarii TaxID=1662864 RepID=UPI003D7FBEA3